MQTVDAVGRTILLTDTVVTTTTVGYRVTRSTYDALGQTLATTSPVGTTRYGYNALGSTVVMTDTAGRVSRSGYDGTGTLRWQQRHDGQLTIYHVDGMGRVATTIENYQNGIVDAGEAADRDILMATRYDAAGRQILTTDAGRRATASTYNRLDQLTSVTENATTGTCVTAPCNVPTQYQYDRLGNRTAIIDALARVRRFSYDAANRQVTATDAANVTTAWSYDKLGRKTLQDDPRGTSYDLQFAYDELDRITQTLALNMATPVLAQYDALGRRTQLADESGTTTFAYNPLGYLIDVNRADGRVQYTYTSRGDRTQVIYPTGTSVSSVYNHTGALAQVKDGSTTLGTYGYDLIGRVTTLTRTNGATTAYGYDAADREVRQTTTAPGMISSFGATLNAAGQRTQLTETTTSTFALAFDGINDTATTTTTLGAPRTVEAWVTISSANQAAVIMSTLNPSTGEGWTLRLADGIVIFEGGTGVLGGSYYTPSIGTPFHVAFTSAETEEGASNTLYINGVMQDGEGAALLSSGGVLRLGGNSTDGFFAGKLDAIRISSTTRYSGGFTPPTNRLVPDNSTLALYHFDAGFGQTAVNEASGSHPLILGSSVGTETSDPTWVQSPMAVAPLVTTKVTSYTYDGLGRLQQAIETPGSVYSYTYDLVGNRLSAWQDGSGQFWSYTNTDQVVGWSYDAAGNLTNDGLQTYTYNALNQLTSSTPTSGPTTTYQYNGDGALLAQTTGGVTTRFTQDLQAPLSQMLETTSGTTTTQYFYGHERMAAKTGTTRSWYLHDGLGSVRATLNSAGLPMSTATYDPWGQPTGGTQPGPFGFTGEYQNQGLVYLRARWYQPGNGRFTGPDPFDGWSETPYSLHRYQYGYSDPVMNTDPTGMWICEDNRFAPNTALYRYTQYCDTNMRALDHNWGWEGQRHTDGLGAFIELWTPNDFPGGPLVPDDIQDMHPEVTFAWERMNFIFWYLDKNPRGLTPQTDFDRQDFDDTGFRPEFRDSHMADAGSNQVRHFLSAAYPTYSEAVPDGGAMDCVIGHETNPTAEWPKTLRQCLGTSFLDRVHFDLAIRSDIAGDYALRDCYLSEILPEAPEIPFTPGYIIPKEDLNQWNANGGSIQDLRLSLKGWVFGEKIHNGELASLSSASAWLIMNLR
jgi:RHS repeat-associated protein